MTKFLSITFFFITSVMCSQALQGYISEEETNEKLEYANVAFLNNNSGTNSNSSGFYSIDIKKHLDDSIKISYVGFESKYFALKEFNEQKLYILDIKLAKKETELSEVTIENKRKKFTEKRTLGEKRDGNVAMFSLIGFETTCYLENPYQQDGRLKSIKLDIKKNVDADFIAKFNIKIYDYNKEKNQPGEELLTENLIVSPKNKNYRLDINVLAFKIPFPKDGICIGVELIDTESVAKKGNKIGPGLRFTNKESKQITWYNYRGKGFFQGNLGHKKKTGNLIVALDILLEKSK